MHVVLDHPLVRHRVTLLRDRETPPKLFRELVGELTTFLAYEALRDARTAKLRVVTPVAVATGEELADRVVVVPIIRAGVGMLGSVLDLLPAATVGVLGLQRSEKTAQPIPYYSKVPACRDDALALVLDPMLATGASACDAVAQLKKLGYRRIRFLGVIAAPEGLAKFEAAHPDVPVYLTALDQKLNELFYIVPGLGDAGDRLFGTEEHPTVSKLMRALERRVMSDGKVDMAEAGELLRLARPLVGMDDDLSAFRTEIECVRADGVVDPVESYRIANMLAALADKADAFATTPCSNCGHPISHRTFKGKEDLCPWCGQRVRL